GRHGLDREIAMTMLEHRADIDPRIDVGVLRSVLPDRGPRRPDEEIAQGAETRIVAAAISGSGKGEESKAAIRLDGGGEMNGLGIAKLDHRRRVKTLADHESSGESLMARPARQDRGGVVRCRPCGITTVPDKVVLNPGWIVLAMPVR